MNIVGSNFCQSLSAKPVPSAIVARVRPTKIFCKPNVKRYVVNLPNVDVHAISFIEGGIVPC